MNIVPGEMLSVGPYKIWLVAVSEEGYVVVQALFLPAYRKVRCPIPTEKYLELKKLSEAWSTIPEEEQEEVLARHGFEGLTI